MMIEMIAKRFRRMVPAVDYWSLRIVGQRSQHIMVRRGVLEPIRNVASCGAHVTVVKAKGVGYAATCDVTGRGLAEALHRAEKWAENVADRQLFSPQQLAWPRQSGEYHSEVVQPWDEWSLKEKFEFLHRANEKLKIAEAIVDWHASLNYRVSTEKLITPDCEINQAFNFITPGLMVVANDGTETQRRTFGYDNGVQAGLEYLEQIEFLEAERIASQALALLSAPNCPSGDMDLLLLPEQMMLQIHESIGHPLELDRILGDERNYAGTSFVTADMFGKYRYGSELLNITFDPGDPRQLASYGFDDEGSPAVREYLIRQGILLRPLGGLTSQNRAGLPGVANARSCHWNRPAIDRMANINLEPGDKSVDELVRAVERGVLMDTNRSWSIDDSRNKFQFGCEYGRLIENGELGHVVRNPNYRGISATFWRSLVGVGDGASFKLMGTPTCGKGEPNQAIHVGHASPACLFAGVAVFGAE